MSATTVLRLQISSARNLVIKTRCDVARLYSEHRRHPCRIQPGESCARNTVKGMAWWRRFAEHPNVFARPDNEEIAMTEYTNLQIAVLTMDKDALNEAAGIITDWSDRLLNGSFEDDETGEDRRYEMPEDLRPHLEVLGGMRERVSSLVEAIDNFAGYFPMEGDVRDPNFVVEFYKSEAFANAPTVSVNVDADAMDAVVDSARAINEWAVLTLRAKDEFPEDIVAALQSLLGLNFWVAGLIDPLDEALSGERELFDAASR